MASTLRASCHAAASEDQAGQVDPCREHQGRIPVRLRWPANRPWRRCRDLFDIRNSPEYGIEVHSKVLFVCEFEITEVNSLGHPLPKGMARVYRMDQGGRREFAGEDAIDHAPKDEAVLIATGNGFGLVGERVRERFTVSANRDEYWVI